MTEILFYQSNFIRGMGQANVIISHFSDEARRLADVYIIFEHLSKEPELIHFRYFIPLNEYHNSHYKEIVINNCIAEIFELIILKYFKESPTTQDYYSGLELREKDKYILYPIANKYPELLQRIYNTAKLENDVLKNIVYEFSDYNFIKKIQ
ncbi:MAG: hypothetical protein V1779_17620 [bacterium]